MPKLQAVQVGVAKAHAFGKSLRPEQLPLDQVILRAINLLATEHNTNELGYLYTGFFQLGKILLTTTNFDLVRHQAVVLPCHSRSRTSPAFCL